MGSKLKSTSLELKKIKELFQKKQEEAARLYRTFRVLSRKLNLLEDILASFNPLKTPKEFLYEALQKIDKAIKADAGSVFLKNQEGALFFAAATGPKREAILEKRPTIAPGEGLVGWVVTFDQPLIVHEASKDKRFYKKISEEVGYEVRDVICVPLRSRREVIGAIELLNKHGEEPFNADDLDLLEAASRMTSRFLEVVKRIEALTAKTSS